MSVCTLCPRKCGVDREIMRGYCQSGDKMHIARAKLHYWEEPPISGTRGSGTIFFTGCSLRCAFCQNSEISGKSLHGKDFTVEEFIETIKKLEAMGAHNINLVTPTHFASQIAEALRIYKPRVPVVYNCGGYESVETLRMLEGLVDIYLPDFKYLNTDHAKKYSMAEDYPEIAKAALAEMVRQTGEPVFDERGMMKRGVIVRHLLLPGCLADGKRVVKYLHETYGNRIYMSLMSQYTPLESLDAVKYPELNRKVPEYAYEKLVDYAISLGVMQAFIQEGDTAKESFIPPFTLEGV